MDCEQLSQNARKIFEKIVALYPPDPWQRPQWKEEGLVYDNGWHDLRLQKIRRDLIDRFTLAIGNSIVLTAKQFRDEKKELRPCDINLKMCERWLELIRLLDELDFQIETYDLVES